MFFFSFFKHICIIRLFGAATVEVVRVDLEDVVACVVCESVVGDRVT